MIKTFLRNISTNSAAPRPFPGAYPTRIGIRSLDKEVPFEYYGKPCPSLLRLVHTQYFMKGGKVNRLYVGEFDQNGVVYKCNGGETPWQVTFYSLYFPTPEFYREYFGRGGNLYIGLERELIEVNGRKLYTNTFWRKTQWEPAFLQMLDDCSRGRVNRNWFDEPACFNIPDSLAERIRVWSAQRPEPAPTEARARVAPTIGQLVRRAQIARTATAPTPPPPRNRLGFGPTAGQPTQLAPPIQDPTERVPVWIPPLNRGETPERIEAQENGAFEAWLRRQAPDTPPPMDRAQQAAIPWAQQIQDMTHQLDAVVFRHQTFNEPEEPA